MLDGLKSCVSWYKRKWSQGLCAAVLTMDESSVWSLFVACLVEAARKIHGLLNAETSVRTDQGALTASSDGHESHY